MFGHNNKAVGGVGMRYQDEALQEYIFVTDST
jgi:hypothetical protein